MDWTEVTAEVDAKEIDRAGDIAQMVVPYGIYIEDYSHLCEEVEEIAHIDLIDEDLLKRDRSKAKVHVYISPEENPAEAIAFLSERYNAEGIRHTITTANCVEEDWINNWKKYFKPIPVGKKLLIRPTWEEEYDAGDRKVLHLEPGLAFGTGTHETTRLCMELLEESVTAEAASSPSRLCFWARKRPSAWTSTRSRSRPPNRTPKSIRWPTALPASAAT